MSKRKINGTTVTVKDLSGNLKAIILPKPKTKDQENAIAKLYTVLRYKCGAAKTNILPEAERTGLPADRTLVVTYDSYTNLVPFYCEWGIVHDAV